MDVTRHRDLNLKASAGGGWQPDEGTYLGAWLICGAEYLILYDIVKRVVCDVLKLPPHSAMAPLAVGTCEVDGRRAPDVFVAVLSNDLMKSMPESTKVMLKATAAWRIDGRENRFVAQSPEGVRCSLDTIDRRDQ